MIKLISGAACLCSVVLGCVLNRCLFFQIHLISALRLGAPLHPGRVSAAAGFGAGAVQPDCVGTVSEHLEAIQNAAGVPAAPAGAALPEHHYCVPQTRQDPLHHPAHLWRTEAGQTLPVQRGARGVWLQGLSVLKEDWLSRDSLKKRRSMPILTLLRNLAHFKSWSMHMNGIPRTVHVNPIYAAWLFLVARFRDLNFGKCLDVWMVCNVTGVQMDHVF